MTTLTLAQEKSRYDFKYVDATDTKVFVELCMEAYEDSFNGEEFAIFPEMIVRDGDINSDLFSLYVFLFESIKQEMYPGIDFEMLPDSVQSDYTDKIHDELWEDEGTFMGDVMEVFDRHQLFYVVDQEDHTWYQREPKDTTFEAFNCPIQEVW